MNPGPIHHTWMDSSEAPLYCFAFPVKTDVEEIHAFGRAREEWSQRVMGKVAFVCDLSAVDYGAVTALHRKAFTDHMQRFKEFEDDHTAAVGLVARGKMLRGLITAAFWLAPPAFPHKTFESADDARVWAREQLERASER